MTGIPLPTFKSSDISVIIPSFNSQNTIAGCLNALTRQSEAPLEIIVVDSSTDQTRQIILRDFPNVQLIALPSRTFPGPARNLGARQARGQIIAFIDSDCIAGPDWVRRLAAIHSAGHLAAGGAVEVGNPNSITGWAGHMLEFREFLPHDKAQIVAHIPSCNLSFRRSLFLEHGGFPNSYYPQEDLLFNFLLTRLGIKIWFDPALVIRHFTREGLRNYLSHQHRIGRVTRCVLQRIELSGSFIGRHSWAAWFAAPFLGLVKYIRTSLAFLKNYPRVALQMPHILLALLPGAIWWGRGFAAGARTGLSGIRGWVDKEEDPIFEAINHAQKRQP